MKRLMTMLAIAGLCSTGAAFAAQTPAPATTPAPAKAAKATKPAKAAPMAYTGCVAAGTKANTFELKDATAAGSTDKATYDLKGGKFKAHVGHKVEVTGTATKPATGDSVLAVKSVKMVAATCS
jgi:hypothetical protein